MLWRRRWGRVWGKGGREGCVGTAAPLIHTLSSRLRPRGAFVVSILCEK